MNRPFPRKELGQHFLVDRGAARRIVEALAPRPDEPVLEIGPGEGALTDLLLECVPRMAAVEKDRRLAGELRSGRSEEELVLFERDVLELELRSIAPCLGYSEAQPLAVVGNLPYNISKPVALKLVTEREAVDRAVLMFQREVADRLVAAPGGRDYGPLSVLVGETFEVRRLFDLAPGAFRPPPRVRSSVTTWRRRLPDPLPAAEERWLRSCLSTCFAQRRKTLRNNLRARFPEDETDRLLEATGIDGGLRAEMLSPATFRTLAAAWPGGGDRDDDPALL